MQIKFLFITDGSKNLKYCGEISTTPKVVGEWNNGKKIYRKLVTYDYTAGDSLEFTKYNALSQSYQMVGIEVFVAPFNSNRYQFFRGGDWEGDWKIHFFRLENGINFKLGTSFLAYSIRLNIIIDYIEN